MMARKKYSIQWEDDQPVAYEVDGVVYRNIEDVPDGRDRSRLEAMLESEPDLEFDEKEFEQLQKQSAGMERVLLGIFSAVAAVLLLVAGVSAFLTVQKLSREQSAAGRVVEMVLRRDYVSEEDRVVQEYYYPVVEFVSADGRFHSVQMSEGSWPPAHEVGDEVTVRYDPEHPLEARIRSTGSTLLMWILPGITGLVGLGFLIAVIAVGRLMRPAQAPAIESPA